VPFVAFAVLTAAVRPEQHRTQASPPAARYITYDEARPIIEQLHEILPPDLQSAGPERLPSTWPAWVARRDQQIRARLAQGDEDSVVNLLLFGTSFTKRPRITLNELAKAGENNLLSAGNTSGEATAFRNRIESRIDDLIRSMTSVRPDERTSFARRVIETAMRERMAPQVRSRVRDYLMTSVGRVLAEHASYGKLLESAKQLGDPSAEFAERSKLYATRGLSSDTSLMPNFAIERTLIALKNQRLLTENSVHRVGIIGPGLDFTDKHDGYDFYPQQTIQPFAVIDSLVRLGLARIPELQVTTFDLSPRVNEHLRRATASAKRGVWYTVQLPRESSAPWKPDAIEYWARFGDRIGAPAVAIPPPAGVPDLITRAIKIRPAVVSLITPLDTNIVLQRPNPVPQPGFDLLIATNILVYYDVFEQSLAMANVERMLRPGGFLLSNNAVLELPASNVHSIGYETVVYSDRDGDGDHIVWYQRAAGK
jgi:hypothetical protein